MSSLRQSGIRVDREGELIHDGEPIRHRGLRQALFRWLDRLDDGRYILRLDANRFAYLDVDDTPLVARAARIERSSPAGTGDAAAAGAATAVWLALSDGTEELLSAETLTIDDAGVLRCRVRDGRIEARLATSAAAVLGDVTSEAGDDGAPLVSLAGRTFAIAKR